MELFFSKRFQKDYKKLSKNIQKRTDIKLDFLLQDIRHPSLRIKKFRKYRDIFELSITMQYRCLFSIKSNVCSLQRIGKHDEVLK